jgi:hypothetical protein
VTARDNASDATPAQDDAAPIAIPGGTDVFGRVVPPFIVGDKHTVFEWCMIYTDRHSAGAHPDYSGAAIEDMRGRLKFVGATGEGLTDAHGDPHGTAEQSDTTGRQRGLPRGGEGY